MSLLLLFSILTELKKIRSSGTLKNVVANAEANFFKMRRSTPSGYIALYGTPLLGVELSSSFILFTHNLEI